MKLQVNRMLRERVRTLLCCLICIENVVVAYLRRQQSGTFNLGKDTSGSLTVDHGQNLLYVGGCNYDFFVLARHVYHSSRKQQ